MIVGTIRFICNVGVGSDSRRSGCLQALPLGTIGVRQGSHVSGMASHEDRQRWESELFSAQICKDAGKDTFADVGRHCGEFSESRGDWADTEALQVMLLI